MTKPIGELSMDVECAFSQLPEATCSHCLGQDEDILPDSDYEVVATFLAQFNGFCTLEQSHKIRRGDRISKIQHADNPMLPVQGVACSYCTMELPRAKS